MNIYEYQKPVGKINDDIALKNEFIAVYDAKSHREAARFCLAYGRRLVIMMDGVGMETANRAFGAIQEWLDGEAHYQKARSIAGEFNDMARDEKDPIKARFYRTMAQISAVTHVKYHALWATDFAITLINRIYPDDLALVRQERRMQLEILREII